MTVIAPSQLVRQVVADVLDASARARKLSPLSSPERAKLEAEIIDAFAAGEIDRGINVLLGHAKSVRAERALKRLIDSALLTLGTTVPTARAAWHAELSGLAKHLEANRIPASPRESPLRDAFRGLHAPVSADTAKLMRRLAVTQARLDSGLELAMSSPDSLQALRSFFDEVDAKGLPDQTMMGLIAAFADREAWHDVIEVFEAAGPTFRSYGAPAREYALALSMAGQADKARQILIDLIDGGDKDLVTYGLLGKIYKEQADRRTEAGDPAEAKQLTQRAIAMYSRGFRLDRAALYPGINLPSLYESLGDEKSLAKAEATAKVLMTSALQRASYGERSYWDAAAIVECALVLGDDATASRWLERALAADSEPWQRKSTANNLKRLERIRKEAGRDTTVLSKVVEAFDRTKGSVVAAAPDEPGTQAACDLRDLQARTYRFGARSPRRLTGNYQYMGIAHDVRVTPADFDFFERILSATQIPDLSDPVEASKAIDELIRSRFGTERMEDRDSPEHVVYDATMRGLAQFMGAKENSQTNISADWLNRLGDCRQHAPTKVLLFEVWKRGRINELLGQLMDATLAKDETRKGDIEAQLVRSSTTEMRILDAEIIDRSTGELLEEHAMTLLATRKPAAKGEEMLELEEVRLADSFYHHEYAFADGPLAISKLGEEIQFIPERSEGRSVVLRPAKYSVDRSAAAVDFGQLKFRGIQVATPGWEREVPVDGLDMSYLHAGVLALPSRS